MLQLRCALRRCWETTLFTVRPSPPYVLGCHDAIADNAVAGPWTYPIECPAAFPSLALLTPLDITILFPYPSEVFVLRQVDATSLI